MIIHNSTPAAPEAPAPLRMDPVKLEALRAYQRRVVSERLAAGMTSDGRVIDMAMYTQYLIRSREIEPRSTF